MFKKEALSGIFAVLFIILSASLVSAANRYVDDTGNDVSNNCLTQITPCQTIQYAVNQSVSGDTINVAAGTYVEAVNVTKSLILQSTTLHGAIIRPDGTTPLLDGARRVAVYINAVDNVTVDGFEIDGTGGIVNLGIYGFNSDHTTVKNNIVHNMIDDAAHVSGIGIIYYGWGQGINYALVQGNTVSYTDHHGIWIGAVESDGVTPKTSNNNVIQDNTVHHTWQNTVVAPALWGGAIGMDTSQSSSIEGNSIHDTESNQRDIMLINGANTVSINDNILVHSDGTAALADGWMQSAIELVPPSSNMIITNNDITINIDSSSAYGWAVWLPDVTGTSSFSNNVITLTGSNPPDGVHGLVLDYIPNPDYHGLAGDWTIQGNTFQGSNLGTISTGIRLYSDLPSTSHISISQNQISGWANGIRSDALLNAGLVTVHQNNIAGNSAYGFLDGGSAVPINATNNWWGSSSGPGPVGPGTGDKVSGNVDYSNWLQLNFNLTSPVNANYNTTRIWINASTNILADRIDYSLDGGSYKKLCDNCNIYNAQKTFLDGSHILIVRATLDSESDSESVSFFVDNDEPEIKKTLPVDGETLLSTAINKTRFYVKYTEDNPVSVSLYYKNVTDTVYTKVPLTGCPSGSNKECSTNIDLSSSNGKQINYYFELNDSANIVRSAVKTIKIDNTKPSVTIYSPVNKIYPELKVYLTASVDEVVAELEYSIDGGSFKGMCDDCSSYNATKSFSYGSHTLTVRAIDYAGNTNQSSISFSVDNKEPKILGQSPRDKSYTNGTFTVEYTEENLKDITLYYRNLTDSNYQNITKNSTYCPAGKRKECSFMANLTGMDQTIKYYFVVRNHVTGTASKEYTETVDIIVPTVNCSSIASQPYPSRDVLFDITVGNTTPGENIKLDYSDNGGSFKTLCTKCTSYFDIKTLSRGLHQLMIRARDSANFAVCPATFTIL